MGGEIFFQSFTFANAVGSLGAVCGLLVARRAAGLAVPCLGSFCIVQCRGPGIFRYEGRSCDLALCCSRQVPSVQCVAESQLVCCGAITASG